MSIKVQALEIDGFWPEGHMKLVAYHNNEWNDLLLKEMLLDVRHRDINQANGYWVFSNMILS